MLIAQLPDPHLRPRDVLYEGLVDSNAMFRAAIRHLNCLEPPPDLVLLSGDVVDEGAPAEYELARELLAGIRQPLLVIPGNHDEREAMREAFRDGGYLPAAGKFLQFAIDDYPLRLVGLDTLIPGQGGGELCPERLDWLDRTLADRPEVPTLVMMHHPPFVTGIGHMDKIGLLSREAFAEVVAKHAQVERILCGHLHRTIHAQVGGRPAMTCPSPAHQVALDIHPDAPSRFRMEPPGFMLHWWNDGQLVTHAAVIGDYDGPYPFFDADGRMID